MNANPIARLLILSVLVATFLISAQISHAADRNPNIIFILADDLGYTDLGCTGSKYYETPHIDKLAAQGMLSLNHHHSQNCTPTRAALMSGQYPPRTGIYTVGTLTRGAAANRKLTVPENETNLPLDRRTIADQLKAAGYATGMFGKWHIGQTGDYHPSKRGFDEAIVTMGAHFNFKTQPPVDHPADAYLADWLTDKAVDFIGRHKDEPFFLYLPHFGVHSPFDAKKQLIEKFKDKPGSGGHDNPTYAAMIASIDESVGRVAAKLEELGLSQNTILIFASDNGGVGSYGEISGKGITNNAPLRGGKGMLYEGGTRVPLIVRWPGRIKPGTTTQAPTIHVDLFPTLLEIAGGTKPEQTLDGESIVPLLTGTADKLKRDAIYVHFPGYLEGYGTTQWRTTPVGTIQMGDWKLLEFFETGTKELYNLRDDPGERNDLAAAMPDKVEALHKRLIAWRSDLNAPVPQRKKPGDNQDPNAKPKTKQKKKSND